MNIKIFRGDCLKVMPSLKENSIDAIITDPPYGLEFMGKEWDHGTPGVPFWEEMLRIAKPGAMLLSFGGTRTHHRLMVAIEDAGWQIRDVIMWVYGQGFPKSHDISKAIDKTLKVNREVIGKAKGMGKQNPEWNGTAQGRKENYWRPKYDLTIATSEDAKLWDGWGTALKPAYEPIILAMKPLDGSFAENALKWGVAGLWIDGSRIESEPYKTHSAGGSGDGRYHWNDQKIDTPKDYSVIQGRWPANLIHDGSDEVVNLFPNSKTQRIETPSMCDEEANTWGGTIQRNRGARGYTDDGSAARFFYCAKASKSERNNGKVKNNHPTVKPITLLKYLCNLIRTPSKGIILDPFMGSGSTGIACILTGMDFIGIEIDQKYYDIAKGRLINAKLKVQEKADELARGK